MDFDGYTAALEVACRATGQVDGLVLLGSGSTIGATRRDEWSDHDIYVVAADGAGEELRSTLTFLPARDRIVATAWEGRIGFAALYDDGHLIEGAAGTLEELGGVRSGDYEIVFGTPPVEALIEASTRARPDDLVIPPADHVVLALLKLAVGTGRVRRGEVVNGGQFIHGYAITHLCHAVRARLAPASTPVDAGLDPVRRIEIDHPAFGARLAAALDRPAEIAAREVYDLLRSTLEPGWPDFPTAAADVIGRRLGWI